MPGSTKQNIAIIRTKCPEIVGQSKQMLHVLDQVVELAEKDVAVLIRAETGAGKELIARALHIIGRENRPLMCLNVAGYPENLLGDALFGHERGAFTGADKRRLGVLELAANGTVYLDEIGDLPHNVQGILLRVLEERLFQRFGGEKNIKFEARFLAATNRHLESMVQEGGFREDLYYRINLAELNVPALRERTEDILPLTSYYIALYNRKYNKNVLNLSKEAETFFLSYAWPGNIRQLRNEIERALIFVATNQSILELEDFSEGLRGGQLMTARSAFGPHFDCKMAIIDEVFAIKGFEEMPLPRQVKTITEQFERKRISQALTRTRGRVTRAAKELGISPQNLSYKIKKYKLTK